MRMFRQTILFVAILFVSAALLQGCGSTPPVRYYTLSSVGSNGPVSRSVSDGSAQYVLGVGPVDIPDYLERPHIVARNGENETVMAEYDRWAGSLKQDISRVLVEDLSSYLQPASSVLSWKRNIPTDYRVAVEITRLDIVPGRAVVTGAHWAVFVKDQKAPRSLQSKRFTELLTSSDFSAIASAVSKTISQLSEEIATDVKTVAHRETRKVG
jgi:uncharacterized protein